MLHVFFQFPLFAIKSLPLGNMIPGYTTKLKSTKFEIVKVITFSMITFTTKCFTI